MIQETTGKLYLIEDQILRMLTDKYGQIMSTRALIKELGYPTPAAFRQAMHRRMLPITVFKIEHRRGSFALSADVAAWLAKQRCSNQVQAQV